MYTELFGKKAAIHTLGCKVNLYESAVMEESLRKEGAVIVPFSSDADIYIVHTCTVTNMADRKSRQVLHRVKKEHPESILVAVGCYVETESEEALLENGVDLFLGNEEKKNLTFHLTRYLTDKTIPEKTDISKVKEYTKEVLTSISSHTRADVKIEDGCNQFCTYCVIPYARGRIRSKAPEDIYEEIKTLTETGVLEVILSGIHLSSYGSDIGTSLGSLLKDLEKIPSLKRIRLGSLEPRLITEAFVSEIKENTKLCPHFHLSLQSGCDAILKKMNRKYTKDDFRESVRILRKYFPHPAITTDIIVGFPGETEEDFRETCDFVREIGFYELHIFPYSSRPGTVAATFKETSTRKEKEERVRRLMEIGKTEEAKFIQSLIGSSVEVLTEDLVTIEGISYYEGYTREYVKVLLPRDVGSNRISEGMLSLLPNGVLTLTENA